jgi:T5orf172 domain
MPVYILREGQSNIFKVGRTSGSIENVLKRLRTGNSSCLSLFDTVETGSDSACEAFFHRRLRTKRVIGGGWEFFEIEVEEMRQIVTHFKSMFNDLVSARETIAPLKERDSTDVLLAPTPDDEKLLQRLLMILEEQEYLKFEAELISSKLKQRIGLAAGIVGVATWKSQVNRCYDEEMFKRQEPEFYEEILERFHCLDTTAWKTQCPEEYRRIQTTYYAPRTIRSFKLQKAS